MIIIIKEQHISHIWIEQNQIQCKLKSESWKSIKTHNYGDSRHLLCQPSEDAQFNCFIFISMRLSFDWFLVWSPRACGSRADSSRNAQTVTAISFSFHMVYFCPRFRSVHCKTLKRALSLDCWKYILACPTPALRAYVYVYMCVCVFVGACAATTTATGIVVCAENSRHKMYVNSTEYINR